MGVMTWGAVSLVTMLGWETTWLPSLPEFVWLVLDLLAAPVALVLDADKLASWMILTSGIVLHATFWTVIFIFWRRQAG